MAETGWYDIDEVQSKGDDFYDIDEKQSKPADPDFYDLDDPQRMKQQASNLGKQITGDDRYEETELGADIGDTLKNTALKGASYIFDGLDYAGNLMRSAALAGIRSDLDLGDALSEAATYKRRTTAEDLRLAISPDLRISSVDGQFEIGDIGDFAIDFGIDIALDPLTWITFGGSKFLKGTTKAALAAKKAKGVEITDELADTARQRIGKKVEERDKLVEELEKSKPIVEGEGVDRVAEAQRRAQAEQIAKLDELDVDNLPDDTSQLIKIGNDLGVIDEVDMVDAAVRANTWMDPKTLAYKEAFADTMGGLYNVGMQADDESTPASMMGAFLAGAAGRRAGGKIARNKHVKQGLAQVGRKINDVIGPGKKAAALVLSKRNPQGRKIETDIKGWQQAEIAADASDSYRRAQMDINNVMQHAVRNMREGNPVAAANALRAAGDFRDFLVAARNDLWKKEIGKLSAKQLDKYNLRKTVKDSKGKEKQVIKEYSEAKGKDVQPLKNEIMQRANNTFFDSQGNLTDAAKLVWTAKSNVKMTDEVLERFNMWNKATKEAFDIEKDYIKNNLGELITGKDYGLFDSQEIMALRKKAFEAGKNPDEWMDLLDEDSIRTTMDLRVGNPGLMSWTPVKVAKSNAIAKMDTNVKPEGMNYSTRQKAAGAVQENIKKDVLGRQELKNFADKQGVEEANAYIDKFEQAVELASRDKARNTLNTIQKEAGSYIGDVMNAGPRAWEDMKRFNSLVKQGLLLGSYTWLKNNWWSNTRQAFVNSGIMGAVDAANLSTYGSKMKKDLWEVFKKHPDEMPVFNFRQKADPNAGAKDVNRLLDTADMARRNVIEPTHFRDVTQRRSRTADIDEFIWDEKTRQQIAERGTNKYLDKMQEQADKFSRKLYTAQTGQYIEAVARGTTYRNTLEMLLKDPSYDLLVEQFGRDAADEAIKRQATQITNDVFFDYGKLHYFERSFLREIIPFYSFYKQNLFYQGKALFDPTKVTRLNQLGKIGDGRYFGADPLSQEQRDALPEYLRTHNALTWTDKDGNKKIFYTTSDPSQQAFSMLSKDYWFKADFAQQISPLLKSVFEQLAEYDMFRGESLDPQKLGNDPTRQIKYLFSRGYGLMPMYNLVGRALGDTDSIYLDARGNPVTDQEWIARVDNVMSWLTSMYTGTYTQFAGQVGKTAMGKQDLIEALTNVAGPVSTTRLIPEVQARRLRKAQEERTSEEMYDTHYRLRRAKGYMD